MPTLVSDIRYALRLLVKSPGFTTISILTLALGIGANTAIFSVVNALLLKPLPYAEPDRLITIRGNHSLPDMVDIGRESRTLESIGTFSDFNLDLTQGQEPERIDAAIIGSNLFPTLGVKPLLGRYLVAEDDLSRRNVAVVSYAFWQSKLGGRHDIVGSSLTLSGVPYTIVGVMPEGFKMPRGKSQLWAPFGAVYPEAVNARGAHFTYPVGRLRPGVTLAQAHSEIAAIGESLAKLHPEEARQMDLMGLHERVSANLRTPVLILLAAVGMVLLIACANYANLLLAKVAGRTHEMSVRTALGATRWRLVRQLVTESSVISLLGGLAGIVLAAWMLNLLLWMKPETLTLFHAVSVDRRALLFALAASLLTGLVFGLAPAFSVWSTNADLKSSGAASTVRSPLRHALVVAELAVSIVLLIGAGLLIRSFWQVMKQSPGFTTERILTMRFSLPASRYKEIPKQQEFIAAVDRAVKDIPGVESAGLVTEIPLDGSRMHHNMSIKGHEDIPVGQEPEIENHEVTPDYLSTIGVRLLRGRGITADDRADTPLVGVINQKMARQFWPGQDPIGGQVRWARSPQVQWITIVGVAEDSRYASLEEDVQPTLYTPMSQKQQPWKRWGGVVVRTHTEDPLSVAALVKQKVWSVDPQLPLTDVEPLNAVLSESLGERRFHMTLLGSFAALALVLAIVGLYGVMSYIATQRTREVGIRIALGATALHIVQEFVYSALGMIALGVLLGTIAAAAAVRLMASMLFQVRPTDLSTYGAVIALLVFTALLATYIPARRASRTDPMEALRYE